MVGWPAGAAVMTVQDMLGFLAVRLFPDDVQGPEGVLSRKPVP